MSRSNSTYIRHYESGFEEEYVAARQIRDDSEMSERRWKYLLQKLRKDHLEDEWILEVDGELFLHEECTQWIEEVFDSMDVSLVIAELFFVKNRIHERAKRLHLEDQKLEPSYTSMNVDELSFYFHKSSCTVRRHIKSLMAKHPKEVSVANRKIVVSATGVSIIEKEMEQRSYISHLYELNRILRYLEIKYGA